MTDDDKKRVAGNILAIPLFKELMDSIETAAINRCINAEINDDTMRRNAAAEVRVIRQLRQQLETLASQSTERKPAPA